MNRLIDSINLVVLKAHPTLPVYIERIPNNFKRPSIYIESLPAYTEEIAKQSYMDNLSFRIFYMGDYTQDPYGVQSIQEQHEAINRLKLQFLKGYIDIYKTDRKAKVTGLRTGFREYESYIEVDLYITDLDTIRDDSYYDKDGNKYEIMEELHYRTRLENKE